MTTQILNTTTEKEKLILKIEYCYVTLKLMSLRINFL